MDALPADTVVFKRRSRADVRRTRLHAAKAPLARHTVEPRNLSTFTAFAATSRGALVTHNVFSPIHMRIHAPYRRRRAKEPIPPPRAQVGFRRRGTDRLERFNHPQPSGKLTRPLAKGRRSIYRFSDQLKTLRTTFAGT
jgi:hypothetical protein